MIAVEIRGATEVRQKLDRLMTSHLDRKVCKEIADELVSSMKTLVPFWHGFLQQSIRAKPVSDGYDIGMNFYGRFVEMGTAAHIVSDKNYLLKAWAGSKGINWNILKTIIAKHGTKAHPFIQPSIDYVMANFDNMALRIVNKTIRESGFR